VTGHAFSASQIDDTDSVYRTQLEKNAQEVAAMSLQPAADELLAHGGIKVVVEAVTGNPARDRQGH
jgi:transcriptional/translational regulatory protein YebC/TACO1